jgi:HEAT repeat protein
MIMDSTVKQAISVLLVDENPDARRMAAEDIGQSDEIASVAALAAALHDANKGVRDAAFRALLNIGGQKVARAVVESIGDSNIVTRNLVADLLYKIGDPAIPALIPYTRDVNHDVRKFAVDIIGLIGSPDAVSQLLGLLDDPDENVLLAAIEALGNIGDDTALDDLFSVYYRNPLVRPCVTEAVGKIGNPLSSEFLVHALGEQVKSDEPNCLLEYTLIESLGRVGDEKALHLLAGYLSDPAAKLSHVVIHSIVQIQERLGKQIGFSREQYPKLLEVLSDEDEEICISAIKGLKYFNGEDITRACLDILGRSEKIDSYLYPLLLEREHALFLALELLNGDRKNKRSLLLLIGRHIQIAIHSLFTARGQSIADKFIHEAFNKIAYEWDAADEQTRAAIVDLLFILDGDRAAEFLDKMLNDQDPWLRMRVLEIIVSINDPRTPELIARFLDDEDEMVRELAISAISAIRSSDNIL